MSAVAIITARGGSKRIPKKNIKDFCGKPIIAYSIDAALKSGLFDEVMVSTDDDEIAEVASHYGAKVPFMRSSATSNDFATTMDVLKEVIDEYGKSGQTFDIMCCLYPTAPLVTSEKLKIAYRNFLSKKPDVLQSVVKFSFPPQRAFVVRDGRLKFFYPEFASMRSQDLEAWYYDAGQFYFWSVKSFKRIMMNTIGDGDRICRIPFVLDELDVQDIDNLSDWKIAEIKYGLLNKDKRD